MAAEAHITIQVVIDKIPELIKKLSASSPEEARRWAEETLEDAQARAPYKSGTLRGSGQVNYVAHGATLGFYAPYAGYVEMGTRHMAARPYLVPACMAHASRAGEAFADLFKV